MKPADVRFYFDADILGLAKLIAALRADVTYPGDPGAVIHGRTRPACAISTTRTKDPVWVPIVSRQNLLVVTRDSNIKQHSAEVAAVQANACRMVALSSGEATTVWSQLEVVMSQWRRMEGLLDLPGPFIYTVTRTTMAKVLM